MINVYFVLSEYLEDGGRPYADPPEPPDGGCIVKIVAAKTRGQAKYLTCRAEKLHGTMADMPAFAVRKIGTIEGEPHVMTEPEARPWWEKVPEAVPTPDPPHVPRAQKGWNPRDVAILGGDPSL